MGENALSHPCQQPRFQGVSSLPRLSLWKETLVAAGRVAPKVWVCVRGGVAVESLVINRHAFDFVSKRPSKHLMARYLPHMDFDLKAKHCCIIGRTGQKMILRRSNFTTGGPHNLLV